MSECHDCSNANGSLRCWWLGTTPLVEGGRGAVNASRLEDSESELDRSHLLASDFAGAGEATPCTLVVGSLMLHRDVLVNPTFAVLSFWCSDKPRDCRSVVAAVATLLSTVATLLTAVATLVTAVAAASALVLHHRKVSALFQ